MTAARIKFKFIALCLLATLAASGAAQADTIYLTCSGESWNKLHTVDLTNNTVDGYPAIITPIKIHWVHPSDNGGFTTYDIDRTSGAETYQGTIQGLHTGVGTETCTVGSAPATKF